MKAKTLIVMAACMAIGLCASGCQNSMTQTAVAQEDVVHIQIAYENNPGEPLDLACQRWKELLEEQSGGKNSGGIISVQPARIEIRYY